jgi:tripartite-type tricarboxylate transporter receptor subunit TctC
MWKPVFTSIPSVVGHVQGGRVRALGVTSAQRSVALPDVPTIAETAIPGYDVTPGFGLLAPAGTPSQIVRQINEDGNALLKTKDAIYAIAAQGAEPFATTPEVFGGLLKRDIDKWAVVVKETGAKLD